ncbi:MAG: hypothetical protein M3Y27_32260 [Acidobacteriota bacterium]|nr:hypothetical protein [Acidobacteriota bacterium]
MQFNRLRGPELAIMCVMAGLCVAVTIAFLLKDRYQASATIEIENASASDVAQAVNEIATRTFSDVTLTELIQRFGLYKRADGSHPAGVLHRMREDITVRPVSQSPPAFSLAFTSTTKPEAQRITRALVERIMDENVRTHSLTLRIFNAPALPKRPIGPNRLLIVAIGLILGGLAGAMLYLSRQRPRQLT